jgi:hypothetical protein
LLSTFAVIMISVVVVITWKGLDLSIVNELSKVFAAIKATPNMPIYDLVDQVLITDNIIWARQLQTFLKFVYILVTASHIQIVFFAISTGVILGILATRRIDALSVYITILIYIFCVLIYLYYTMRIIVEFYGDFGMKQPGERVIDVITTVVDVVLDNDQTRIITSDELKLINRYSLDTAWLKENVAIVSTLPFVALTYLIILSLAFLYLWVI